MISGKIMKTINIMTLLYIENDTKYFSNKQTVEKKYSTL